MHQRRSSLELVAKALGDLQAKDHTLRYRLARGRSRQTIGFIDVITSIISGALDALCFEHLLRWLDLIAKNHPR